MGLVQCGVVGGYDADISMVVVYETLMLQLDDSFDSWRKATTVRNGTQLSSKSYDRGTKPTQNTIESGCEHCVVIGMPVRSKCNEVIHQQSSEVYILVTLQISFQSNEQCNMKHEYDMQFDECFSLCLNNAQFEQRID